MSENLLIPKPQQHLAVVSHSQLAQPETKALTAYSYIRWSSELQTKGDSLRRQMELTRSICTKMGFILDESLRPDEAVSAYNGENGKKGSLAHFLSEVKNGRIKTPCILVVEALDRLTRVRLHEARKLFDELLESDVQICTARNGKLYDRNSLNNPFDLFLSLMELSAAHEYSANIARRVGAAWGKKRNDAITHRRIITGNAPAWLEVDAKKTAFSVIDEKANIVRRIFRDYAGGKGIRTIVGESMAQSLLNLSEKGKINNQKGDVANV